MTLDPMRRREFTVLLGASDAAWPLAARAQQPQMPVVGYLSAGSPETSPHIVVAFRKGLSEAGCVEGRNVAIEYRWANDQFDRLPELVADLVRRRVDVIVAVSGTAALAAKAVTAAIPIVFNTSGDPVQAGLVASLSRPGGNVTGISDMGNEIAAKRIGLLHELLPKAARFSILIAQDTVYVPSEITEAQAAAAAIGRQIDVLTARTSGDIDTAFASLVQNRAQALLVNPSSLFRSRRVQIVTLATRHTLPAVYSNREFAEVGGLMSYGSSNTDHARQVGIYAGRILKGEKPADLPVQQAVKFEFVINLQTARTLCIDVPPTLLALADEVIE
jgi:putative ABC transport system substrate-binding protein